MWMEYLPQTECLQKLVIHLHFMCLLKMRLHCNLYVKAHRHAVRRLANRHGSQTVSHAPVLEYEEESMPMASKRLNRTLSAL